MENMEIPHSPGLTGEGQETMTSMELSAVMGAEFLLSQKGKVLGYLLVIN